ncbi:MAG: hypothetical protein HY010_09595 [Acidobacteria bacterium]|nr:hypothetical protein [Acidobacteriota bacterium]
MKSQPTRSVAGIISEISATRTWAFVVCLLALAICAPGLSAQTYKDIYEFDGTTHGCCPLYPELLAQGRDGNLYGTTTQGGTSGGGIAFKITPDGTLTVLYNFDIAHGYSPSGGLILGADGNFYGTTQSGGAHSLGNIFKITPAGVFTVLYSFAGGADGGDPIAALMLGTDGNFYGTSAPGVAFKMSAKGVFKVLNKIPYMTYGPLAQGSDGAFYGTTQIGGTANLGTVFKIVKTTVTTLYNFDTTHGRYPFGGLVQGNDGNLYGTTSRGGSSDVGVVYKITPGGSLTVLHNFDSVDASNGNQAYAGLVAATDGNLYSSTAFGGNAGNGTLFEITTGGAFSVLSSFDVTHGAGAYATGVQYTNGKIFGLTSSGGTPGEGVVYSLDNSMPPFVLLTSTMGVVGKSVGILGNGFTGTTSVKFNGASASFKVVSDTYLTAKVPSGETGTVTVTTPSGTLSSSKPYRVTPKITSVTPASGAVGSTVVIAGSGFIQATGITLGGVKVTSFTVNSDKQVTLTVPAGAKTGKVVITTPGGAATSATFTVT